MKVGIKTKEPQSKEVIFENLTYRNYIELAEMCKYNDYILIIYDFSLEE